MSVLSANDMMAARAPSASTSFKGKKAVQVLSQPAIDGGCECSTIGHRHRGWKRVQAVGTAAFNT